MSDNSPLTTRFLPEHGSTIVRSGPLVEKGDSPPSWPLHPFDDVSRKSSYAQWFYPDDADGKPQHDPRERYLPTREDIASFRWWAIDFNPYGPNWAAWGTVLIAEPFRVPLDSIVMLDIPTIITMLDNTHLPDETKRLADGLRFAAGVLRTHPGRGDVRYLTWLAADLLLKAHVVPRELHVIATVFPTNEVEWFYQKVQEYIGANAAAGELSDADTLIGLAESLGATPRGETQERLKRGNFGSGNRPAVIEKLSPLEYAILMAVARSPVKLTRDALAQIKDVTDIGRDPKTIRGAVNRLIEKRYVHDDHGLTVTEDGEEYLTKYPPTDSR